MALINEIIKDLDEKLKKCFEDYWVLEKKNFIGYKTFIRCKVSDNIDNIEVIIFSTSGPLYINIYHKNKESPINVASISETDSSYFLDLNIEEFDLEDETEKELSEAYYIVLRHVVEEIKKHLGVDLEVFPFIIDKVIKFVIKYKDKLFFRSLDYGIGSAVVAEMRENKYILIEANVVKAIPAEELPSLKKAYERFIKLYKEFLNLLHEGEKYNISDEWREKGAKVFRMIHEKYKVYRYGITVTSIWILYYGYKEYNGKSYFLNYVPFDILEKLYNEHSDELEKMITAFKKQLEKYKDYGDMK